MGLLTADIAVECGPKLLYFQLTLPLFLYIG